MQRQRVTTTANVSPRNRPMQNATTSTLKRVGGEYVVRPPPKRQRHNTDRAQINHVRFNSASFQPQRQQPDPMRQENDDKKRESRRESQQNTDGNTHKRTNRLKCASITGGDSYERLNYACGRSSGFGSASKSSS
ncbi:hypothetical protein ABG067_006613 [Albugo candida]